MVNFYISDFHWGHQEMVNYDNCPFDTIEEQEEAIIRNWNKRVRQQDTGYILGDVSYKPRDETLDTLAQLNGNVIVLKGNHDRWIQPANDYCPDCLTIKDEAFGQETYVFLCHYPCAVWDREHDGGVHIYGHVHSRMNNDGTMRHAVLDHYDMERAFNCGCMIPYMDYTPRTLYEIMTAHGFKQL